MKFAVSRDPRKLFNCNGSAGSAGYVLMDGVYDPGLTVSVAGFRRIAGRILFDYSKEKQ